MRITGTHIGWMATFGLLMGLGSLAWGAWGTRQPLFAEQAQQDSSQKQAEPEKPAPAAQDKPSQDQPAQNKPDQAPEDQNPPGEKQKPAQPAPSQSSNPAAGAQSPTPAPAGTASQETAPASPAPTTGAPEDQPATPATEVPVTSTAPNSKSTNGSRRPNGAELNPKRKLVVREGGTADANTMLAPSMTPEQASRQRGKTLSLLASADANLQKISGRQLNANQQAMVEQARAYMQQSKDALNRGDLQRSHNLALKASLLTDDLLRH